MARASAPAKAAHKTYQSPPTPDIVTADGKAETSPEDELWAAAAALVCRNGAKAPKLLAERLGSLDDGSSTRSCAAGGSRSASSQSICDVAGVALSQECVEVPPSTAMICPVTNTDSSDASHSAVAAMCELSPLIGIGWVAIALARYCS